MLEEIHLAGSVRTPFGSFCGAFADVSAQSGGGGSGAKPEDVKERLVENILRGALGPDARMSQDAKP
jgi:hypothetical protein